MRSVLLFLALCGIVSSASSQTILDLRVGMQDRATLHLANLVRVREPWVYEVGYIDFGSSDYREAWIGGGYRWNLGDNIFVQGELLFAHAFGPAAEGATYLQPFSLIHADLTDKLAGEIVYFPYLPLDDAGTVQHVLERVKLEYAISSVIKAGGGYGGYQFGNERWQHKPFLTTTVTPAGGKYGSLEFWIQRLPGGDIQTQFRYELVKIGKKK